MTSWRHRGPQARARLTVATKRVQARYPTLAEQVANGEPEASERMARLVEIELDPAQLWPTEYADPDGNIVSFDEWLRRGPMLGKGAFLGRLQ